MREDESKMFLEKIDDLEKIYEPIDILQESHLSFMKRLNLGNKNIQISCLLNFV